MPHPALPGPTSGRRRSRARRCSATFGNVNASKRVPQLLDAFARVRRRPARSAPAARRRRSPGFDLERRLQRLGLDDDGLVREGYVDEARLWSLMAACDVHVNLRSPTMGETSGTGDPRALAREAADRQRRRLVRGAAGRGRAEGAGRRARGEALEAALELLATRPDVRAGDGRGRPRARPARARPRARGRSLRRRFEQAAGGEAVDDAVLGRSPRRPPRSGSSRARPRRARSRAARRGRARWVSRLRAVPAWAWLAGSSSSRSLRAWLARGMVGPFIMVDELIYSELAKSFADGRRLASATCPRGLRRRLPRPDRARLRRLRPRSRRVRGDQDDQRARDVARGDPRLPARAARASGSGSRCSPRCSRWRCRRWSTPAR